MDTLEKGYGLRCVACAVVDSVGCVNRSTGCCCGPLSMELEREAPPGCGWRAAYLTVTCCLPLSLALRALAVPAFPHHPLPPNSISTA